MLFLSNCPCSRVVPAQASSMKEYHRFTLKFMGALIVLVEAFSPTPTITKATICRSLQSSLSKNIIRSRSTVFHCSQTKNDGEADDHDEELFRSIFENEEAMENDLTSLSSVYDKQMGAGVPRAELGPEDIVSLLMTGLENNDVPSSNSGLISMWEFATDTTKFVFQNNRTEFIESCHETAREFPTSFYGVALNGKSWEIENRLNRVGGEDGWIATHVMKTISSDGRLRRWQWELRKNKRPPCLGCWKVENIASSDRKGDFEPD